MRAHIGIALAMLASSTVSANGINPPGTDKVVVLVAKCHNRDSGASTTLYRAALRTPKLSRVPLEIRPPDRAAFESRLEDIVRLEVSSRNAHGDGFTRASVSSPRYSGDAGLRLGRGDDAVSVTGFDSAGARVNIPLAKCKRLDVSHADAPSTVPVMRSEKKS